MAIFTSSTQDIPSAAAVPRHVAIIMDGNGRWAKKRCLPRFAGHRRGVETVRDTIKYCLENGIEYLTLFAFSSENWRRPEEEVTLLMQLFFRALQQEVSKLERNGVRLKVIGDLSPFDQELKSLILASERLTAGNEKLTLTIAANYGGRWDILQAVNRMVLDQPEKKGRGAKPTSRRIWPCITPRSPIFLFAPVANSESAIFCFGNLPMRNSTLPMPSGRSSMQLLSAPQ